MVLGAPGMERAVGAEDCTIFLYVSGAGGAEALGTPVTATAASSLAAQPSSVLTYTTAVEIFDQRFNLLLGAYVSCNYCHMVSVRTHEH